MPVDAFSAKLCVVRRTGILSQKLVICPYFFRLKYSYSFGFQTLLQEVRHKEVNATRHNEFLNAKLRDVSHD